MFKIGKRLHNYRLDHPNLGWVTLQSWRCMSFHLPHGLVSEKGYPVTPKGVMVKYCFPTKMTICIPIGSMVLVYMRTFGVY